MLCTDDVAERGVSARADRLRAGLASRGVAEARVSGDSMLPTLLPGDIVRLVPVRRPRCGDIVAFERGGGLLVHRVAVVTPQGVVCRGDNRLAHDGLTRPDEVIGRAVAARSGDGESWRTLADGVRGHVRARARYFWRRARLVVRRLALEWELLASQAGGQTPQWRREDLGSRLVPHDSVHRVDDSAVPGPLSTQVPTPHVLAADEVGATGALAATAATARLLVVPADTYSHLPGDARRALVASRLGQGVPSGRTVVFALARGRQARVAHVTAAVRRALLALGAPAGEPGDAALPGRSWPRPTYARFFTAKELADELRAAGAEVVRLRPAFAHGVELWQAEVRSSSEAT